MYIVKTSFAGLPVGSPVYPQKNLVEKLLNDGLIKEVAEEKKEEQELKVETKPKLKKGK